MSKGRIKENIEYIFVIICILIYLFIILFSLILPANINTPNATNYYVSPNGWDSNDGLTIATPWKSVNYAVQRAYAGDTIYLMDGTWTDEQVYFGRAGNATNPIKMVRYSGNPTLYGGNHAISIQDSSYITLDGITISHSKDGLDVRNSNSINLFNITILDPLYASSGLSIMDGSHDVLVDSCRIEGDAWNSLQISGRNSQNGLWMYNISSNITINNCTISDNNIHGLIDFFGIITNITVKNNHLFNGRSGTIYSHQGLAEKLYIKNNLIHDSSMGIYFDGGATNSYIENNTIYNIDSTYGNPIYWRNGNWGTSQDNIINNNTIFGDSYSYMIRVESSSTNIERNNVIGTYGDPEYLVSAPSGNIRAKQRR